MAELIITEEERRTLTFLEWDDAALGKAVKKIAIMIADKDGGRDTLPVTAAGVFLISRAVALNTDGLTLVIEGATNPEPLGDWKIVITRMKHSDVPEVCH